MIFRERERKDFSIKNSESAVRKRISLSLDGIARESAVNILKLGILMTNGTQADLAIQSGFNTKSTSVLTA